MARKSKAGGETQDPRVVAWCTSGSEAMTAGRYPQGLADFEKALAIDPDHLYARYGAAYCLACLANAAPASKARALRRKVLAHGEKIVALAPEPIRFHDAFDNMRREMLRFTYNARAWYRMLDARSTGELERALADVDHGLGIVSPNEDGSVLNALRDTRVRLLLKLGRLDEAFDIVQRYPKHPDFKDLLADPRFQAWKARGGVDALLHSKPGETAGEALVRLRDAIAKYGHATYAALIFSDPVPPKEVAETERLLRFALPPSYVRFVTRYGACKLIQKSAPQSPGATSYAKLHGCREVLAPDDLDDATQNLFDNENDARTEKRLEDSLAFQQNPYSDNFYTFRVSSAAKHGGEMAVHAYFHDDVYTFGGPYVSFDAHIRRLVEEILATRDD